MFIAIDSVSTASVMLITHTNAQHPHSTLGKQQAWTTAMFRAVLLKNAPISLIIRDSKILQNSTHIQIHTQAHKHNMYLTSYLLDWHITILFIYIFLYVNKYV